MKPPKPPHACKPRDIPTADLLLELARRWTALDDRLAEVARDVRYLEEQAACATNK